MATVLQQQEGVVSFDIKIDGQKIKDTVEIISISQAWDEQKKSESATGFEPMTSQTQGRHSIY